MNWFIKDRVLHATYRFKEDIPPALLRLTDDYEGAIPHRVGWNIPFAFLVSCSPSPSSPSPSPSPSPSSPSLSSLPFLARALRNDLAEYLVVYPEKDIQTKKHELLHARYRMDPVYQQEVRVLWASLSSTDQKKVHAILRALHYPDDPDILLDEFQAYYYTEPPRFFGLAGPLAKPRPFAKKKSPMTKRK